VAEELPRGEGFTEVQYVKIEGTVEIEKTLTSGEADIGMNYAAPIIIRLDAGVPVVVLAGGHVGCLELFGTERVQALRDLKAADICAREPERVARLLVDKGHLKNYDHALQVLEEIPYGRWREYDPEDTLRFHALRLHEIGMIKSSPQKIIAEGTDWRFLNELKKELMG
jgi:hypothetical protein